MLPSWLFDARLYVGDWLTSSRPDAILVTLLPTKTESPTTPHLHQMSHPRQPYGDFFRARELNVSKRDVHLDKSSTVKIHDLGTNWRPLVNNTRFYVSA